VDPRLLLGVEAQSGEPAETLFDTYLRELARDLVPDTHVRRGAPELWTQVWIPRPQSIRLGMGVCGLCRALTPPKHDDEPGRV
jgi:hypothetical protein